MSRKWVEREGRSWIDKEIITATQYEKILEQYPEKGRVTGLLPIFASILIGAGILTFIASNWQGIPQLIRLFMILVALVGFYLTGGHLHARGSKGIGIALIGVGLVLFGGGIILTGQMYHLIAFDARAFIFWALGGILLLYLYKSRFLYILTLLILNIAQLYSMGQFNQVSLSALFILIIGLGIYNLIYKSSLLHWLLSFSIFLHLLILVNHYYWPMTWLLLGAMGIYSLGDWVRHRIDRVPLQSTSLIVAFIYAVFFIFGLSHMYSADKIFDHKLVYLIIFIGLFLLSMIGKWRQNRLDQGMDWVMFIPFFYLPHFGGDVLYLIVLFLYSGYLLWSGYRDEWREKVNMGTLLFLISTLIGYVHVAWSFMPKSLFFIVGGTLLLLLSWFLERKRRTLVTRTNQSRTIQDQVYGEGGSSDDQN